MAEAIFDKLRKSLEKRDQELGRESPVLNLEHDSRYWKFSKIVRAQLGREELDISLRQQARAHDVNQHSQHSQRAQLSRAVNEPTLRGEESADIAQVASSRSHQQAPEHDPDVIDLIDDDISPVAQVQSSTRTAKPSKVPPLFEDEEETKILEDSPARNASQDTDLDEMSNAPGPASKRKGSESNNPPKRRRTKQTAKETRGDRYRSAPAKWILDRMKRSSQRLCLVRFKRRGEEGMVLDVMGSNGSLYKVSIALAPTCTCKDFTGRAEKGKNGPCKHLIFAFLRVFKLKREDPRWWQTRLLPSELNHLLDNAPAHLGDGVMAEQAVQQQLRALEQQNSTVRRTVEGDCPVCFEDLLDADCSRPEDVTSFCKKCGNNFHQVCLENWVKVQSGSPTCPLCRQTLKVDGESEGGYVNLAAYSSMHQRQLTLAEMYSDTHQYIGRSGRGGQRPGVSG